MRKFGLYLFLFALVSFVACQKDPTQTPADPAATEVKGSVTFESVNSTEEEFGWVWEADVDRIGLFTEVMVRLTFPIPIMRLLLRPKGQ